ncbi:neuropilin and tolloid-like protein 1 isoform X2 [Ptychodera flava]|uniref:neuropilin and tolloid-like protein 1 isoform X2 n=1 Tax=Ptychodera flava TaxID=63121 RepID=UPI00396A4D5A
MGYMKFVLIATSMFIHQAMPETIENSTIAVSCNKHLKLNGRKNIGLPVSPYENYMRCEYAIESAPNTFIELEFKKMKLEDSPQCSADSITIFDGGDSTSPEIGKFCGDELLQPLTSSGRNVFMVFQSDGKNVDEGFEIKLTPIHDDRHSSRTDFYDPSCNVEENTGRDGSDINSGYDHQVNSVEECCDRCRQTEECVSYAYDKRHDACWMKNGIPQPTFSVNFDSGIVPLCNRRRENIEIYDTNGKLLDMVCDSGSAIATEGGMKLVMHITNEEKQEKGFMAIYALFYQSEGDGKCRNNNDYFCNNWRCIPRYLTEDKHDHCGDGSDLPEPKSKGLPVYGIVLIVLAVLLVVGIGFCVCIAWMRS